MKNKFMCMLLLLPALSGCVPTKIIDEQNLITTAGIDLTEDEKLIVTAVFADYLPDKSVKNQFLTVTINKDADILDHLDRQSSKPVLVGDMDVFMLGNNLAKKGIFPIVDSLQRDANIGSRLYFVLAEGSINELLKGSYSSEGNTQYISDMVEHNIKFRDIPRTNLHLFASDFFQKGKDPYAPILKKMKEDTLQVDGLGIFRDGKLTHKIPPSKMFYFKILVDEHTRGSTSAKIGKESAVITSINSRYAFRANYETLTVDIAFTIKGVVTKYTGKRVNPQVLSKIKKAVEKQIDKESLKLLTDFQERGIDPVGIERKFKQQNRNFDSKKWKDQYQHVKFNVNTKVIFMESGTVE